MEKFLASPELWVVVALISELVALSPAKDNSIIQVIIRAVKSLKKTKK